MKNYILLLLITIINFCSFAQKNVFISIAPKANGNDLAMGTDLISLNGVKFNLDHFDYYLSDLHLVHDGGQILDLSDTVFLVEPNSHILYLGFLNVNTIEQINFAVGVPENLNTSSGADAIDISAYPEGHPLSFQEPSMHWGWTAGYMHMIIGGMADSNADDIIDYIFEVHNVGNNNYRHVQLPVVQTDTYSDQIDIYVNCHADVWLKDIPIESVGILHGSTGYNMEIMKNVETEVVFDQSATASVPSKYEAVGNTYFFTNGQNTTIKWENVINASFFKLIDLNGKDISLGVADGINGEQNFQNLPSGTYHFQLFSSNNNLLNELKVVK